MQSFFHFVLSNQEVYGRVRSEVREAQKAGKLSKTVSWAEAQELSYFQACLKEAMRLRPAVGLSIQRYVPPGGAVIDGNHYPEGIIASVNAWPVHRDTTTFGKDADDFRPERWLQENAKEMAKHLYQVCTSVDDMEWLNNEC